MKFTILSCLFLFVSSTFAVSFDCNYINLGFNVVQPVGECVINGNKQNTEMSMAHYCIDDQFIESRLYDKNNCNGNSYEIINVYDCNSNSSFVKCNCKSSQKNICPTITDIQYKKNNDGSCDKSFIIESRTYLVDDIDDVPQSLMDDNNCFERKSTKQS